MTWILDMPALRGVLWGAALVFSSFLTAVAFGKLELVAMFPEGGRWWHGPLRLLALAIFAAVVLSHPFGG